MSVHDVVVVGAGPAGTALSALLAERGVDVVCLERATFPRGKACAEYLSPEAGRMLARIGALEAILRERPARLNGMRVVSADGTGFEGRFRRVPALPRFANHGLALPRERLDAQLARAALARGADLREGIAVDSIAREHHGVLRLGLRHGARHDALRARVVVGADGLHSRVAAWLGTARHGRRRRVALVTHVRPVAGMTDVGEMHVTRGAYVGLAHVGDDVTNVAVVADAGALPPHRSLTARFDALITRFPAVAARLRRGERVSPVRGAGPFARWTTRATGDGVLLVGDAADFYDPFTGEGIYAALRGAELASDRIDAALRAGRFDAAQLAPYDRDRQRTFRGKWLLERAVGAAVTVPALLNHAARRLAARPALADLLVGAAGDFVPAARVLRPAYLWQLLR